MLRKAKAAPSTLPPKTFDEVCADITEAVKRLPEEISAIRIAPGTAGYMDVKSAAGETVREWMAGKYPGIKIISVDAQNEPFMVRRSLWAYSGVNHAT